MSLELVKAPGEELDDCFSWDSSKEACLVILCLAPPQWEPILYLTSSQCSNASSPLSIYPSKSSSSLDIVLKLSELLQKLLPYNWGLLNLLGLVGVKNSSKSLKSAISNLLGTLTDLMSSPLGLFSKSSSHPGRDRLLVLTLGDGSSSTLLPFCFDLWWFAAWLTLSSNLWQQVSCFKLLPSPPSLPPTSLLSTFERFAFMSSKLPVLKDLSWDDGQIPHDDDKLKDVRFSTEEGGATSVDQFPSFGLCSSLLLNSSLFSSTEITKKDSELSCWLSPTGGCPWELTDHLKSGFSSLPGNVISILSPGSSIDSLLSFLGIFFTPSSFDFSWSWSGGMLSVTGAVCIFLVNCDFTAFLGSSQLSTTGWLPSTLDLLTSLTCTSLSSDKISITAWLIQSGSVISLTKGSITCTVKISLKMNLPVSQL